MYNESKARWRHQKQRHRPSLGLRVGATIVLASGLLAAALTSGALATTSPSPNLFAIVDQSGNLIHGGGVSSVSHVSTGQYEVTFNQDVSGCAYEATTTNAYSQALLINANGGHSSANGVFVETKNQGGGLTDGPFSLIVSCGGTGSQYAVVDPSGNLARSTPGASLVNASPGRYYVTFPAGVTGCAFLSTIGDSANGVVFNPGLVATASGPNANTVYVETKNLGGGLQGGFPFHLVVLCRSAPSTTVAVIRATGLTARGSGLTSSFNAATGIYTVVTNHQVASTCATIATRGQANASVPFDPATVETAPGPAPNTFDVQTRLPLDLSNGGQGTYTNEDFHSAIVC